MIIVNRKGIENKHKDFLNERHFATISIPLKSDGDQLSYTIDAYEFQDGTTKPFENLSISKVIAVMRDTLKFSSFSENDLTDLINEVTK